MAILQNAVISFSTAADQTVIAAVSGKQIKVYALNLVAAGATTVTVKDGSTALTGAMTLATGVPITYEAGPFPWFVTSQGNALVINDSGAVQVSGNVLYETT